MLRTSHAHQRSQPLDIWHGLAICVFLGCPGVEPTEAGVGGTGATGPSTTSAGGEDKGGATTMGPVGTGTGGTGGVGAGGMSVGGSGGGCGVDTSTSVEHCGMCNRPCPEVEAVAARQCVEGVCRPICAPGRADIDLLTNMDDTTGCEAVGRRVFVTHDPVTLPLVGGAVGGDGICHDAATNAKLGGTWKAWLSDETRAPADDPPNGFLQSTVPYILLNGDVVANSWITLTGVSGPGGLLQSSIHLTEKLQPVAQGTFVWTGTTAQGTSAQTTCDDWEPLVLDLLGTVGNASLVGPAWTSATTDSCEGTAHLYCFEQ